MRRWRKKGKVNKKIARAFRGKKGSKLDVSLKNVYQKTLERKKKGRDKGGKTSVSVVLPSLHFPSTMGRCETGPLASSETFLSASLSLFLTCLLAYYWTWSLVKTDRTRPNKLVAGLEADLLPPSYRYYRRVCMSCATWVYHEQVTAYYPYDRQRVQYAVLNAAANTSSSDW